MSKTLVIVESPGKIKKIGEILGSNYIIKASFGHCLDLDPKTLSIEIDNNYNPIYKTVEGKQQLVNDLKALTKSCNEVILASDEDREGEAIASSLATILKLKNPKRIVFHEITKKAILEAIANPKEINYDMVYAQQARRLLDRLVGYKISPLLWSYIKTENTQSAGRVQSVVVKIINDKENEIINSLNNSYYKTSIELLTNTKSKLNGLLMKDKELFKFNNIDNAKEFLNLINKKTIFKVISIDNRESTKNPSPPFITSTLQQEASTKLGFNVKKTMDVAQKLYEGGFITYMRTDSTNLSQEALNDCKTYIEKTYGLKYSRTLNYTRKVSGAQEAHEAIRPTHIENKEISTTLEGIKLYNLIWKRTIASQMAPAKINIQTINIDTINESISILNKKLWVSVYESIIFDGYLILYNNNEDTDDEKQEGKFEIKVNEIVNFKKIKVTEEYTKSPLRFNEAGLIKYLEKNNIGRPSTYASIINKIIDRNYVEIKNIDGIKKESKQLEYDNKYKIKETVKEVIIGKENKKLVPTNMGITVNNFMVENFDPIMQIDFTSQFEEYLDKISEGKARWYNVLDIFYQKFNPMVEKLATPKKSGDNLLGINPKNNNEIYVGNGKYGPYIKIMNNNKWKYYSIKDTNIKLEEAIDILKYPIELGRINKKNTSICKGRYGIYLKHGSDNITLNNIDEDNINLEYIKNLINSSINKNYKNK
jgi:DNA topoisomerase-1